MVKSMMICAYVHIVKGGYWIEVGGGGGGGGKGGEGQLSLW